MNVLIFGASGNTGKYLVKQALERDHNVTAFVRDPEKLTIQSDHLKIVQGNVINYAAVEQAVSGQDAVLSALGANTPFKYDQSIVDGLKNIIRAMEIQKVRRLVYLSFLGVKDSRKDAGFFIRNIAPRLLRSEIAGHEARENMIRQSHLDWTIVKSPKMTNGLLTKKYKTGEDIKTKAFLITLSRADIADCMLRQLTDDSYFFKAVRVMP